MSPAEALAGWVMVNTTLFAGGLAAGVLWTMYEEQVARYRERWASREESPAATEPAPRPITVEDRARAAIADHQLLAEVAREFDREHSR